MRGITLGGRSAPGARRAALLLMGTVLGAVAPRNVKMEQLTHVPLRDLALESQYAEIRQALVKYSAAKETEAGQGANACRKCGTVSPDEHAVCLCGAFLHGGRVFTCPNCTRVVARESQDCDGCGASFWSPVNPPETALTEEMVGAYLRGLEGP